MSGRIRKISVKDALGSKIGEALIETSKTGDTVSVDPVKPLQAVQLPNDKPRGPRKGVGTIPAGGSYRR